jgi:RimJ/RimL family protein N-acetyltransferase
MELREFTADDVDDVRRFVDLTNAVGKVDSPWVHPATVSEYQGQLRYGWDGEPPTPFLALVDGEPVGQAEYSTSEWDNHHLAWLWVAVHPDRRRQGYGGRILDALVERAREEERTSVGIGGWESDATRAFAARHGLDLKSQDLNRRQFLAELNWEFIRAMRDAAATQAADYELVRRLGATPEEELEALAEMTAAINDAPTDDLDIEDEVFPAERVRNYESAQLARGYRFHRVFARHRETGQLAGHTVVVVDGERPHLAEQHDTSVVRAHRGHRLGLLLKAELLLWLHETQPQVESIDTWNAESNDHMIEVNEKLGYRIMGRALAFQRAI